MYEAARLQDELSRRSGRRVLLCLTNNRRCMVSARSRGAECLEVRLQRFFLESPEEVLDELGDLLAGRKNRSRGALKAFVDARLRQEPSAKPPPPRPDGAGAASLHHDLAAIAGQLNALYLGGRSKAVVVWGKRNRVRSGNSIRFGCYDPTRNRIIMNRKLDRPDIPAYFVEFILFHEMLHEVLGIESRPDGRRGIHGRLFKLMESTYPDYEKALHFERELCARLESL